MATAFLELLARVRERIQPPVLIALGAPRLVADLVATLALPDVACFQFDLFQAGRLRRELAELGAEAEVQTAADLWDIPRRFRSVLVPSPARGERELKRDIVEQSYHVLSDGGQLVVLSPVAKDQFYPTLIKKIFGRGALLTAGIGTAIWAARRGDKPRRRHEVIFHVRDGESSLVFRSQPGVFTYGRLDDGARALAEVMRVEPGDRILDIGCGVGAVGILAARRAGSHSTLTLVDSHCRAVRLAAENAAALGVPNVTAHAAAQLEGMPAAAFDLALANPPYYAQNAIARLFIEGAHRALASGGRFYLVTKQADVVGEMMAAVFGEPKIELRRGYAVLCATKR
jgi:16S rRNA (guanine1207-N2)-methyltransferase